MVKRLRPFGISDLTWRRMKYHEKKMAKMGVEISQSSGRPRSSYNYNEVGQQGSSRQQGSSSNRTFTLQAPNLSHSQLELSPELELRSDAFANASDSDSSSDSSLSSLSLGESDGSLPDNILLFENDSEDDQLQQPSTANYSETVSYSETLRNSETTVNYSETVSYSETPRNSEPAQRSLKTQLADCAREQRFTEAQTKAVLKVLRDTVAPYLPQDPRTLLNLESTATLQDDNFVYFGIQRCLEKMVEIAQLTELPPIIELIVNIDGLPIFAGSHTLTPVLFSTNLQSNLVGIVSVHHKKVMKKVPELEDELNAPKKKKKRKPKKKKTPEIEKVLEGDSRDVYGISSENEEEDPPPQRDIPTTATEPKAFAYLGEFIKEANQLEETGFMGSTVMIKRVTTDLVALAEIKNIFGHTATYACPRCYAKAVSVNRRMCYDVHQDVPPRTHEDFIARKDSTHHHSMNKTPFESKYTVNLNVFSEKH